MADPQTPDSGTGTSRLEELDHHLDDAREAAERDAAELERRDDGADAGGAEADAPG